MQQCVDLITAHQEDPSLIWVIGAKGQTHATKACLGAVRNKVPLN